MRGFIGVHKGIEWNCGEGFNKQWTMDRDRGCGDRSGLLNIPMIRLGKHTVDCGASYSIMCGDKKRGQWRSKGGWPLSLE